MSGQPRNDSFVARARIDPADVIGPVSRRLFGAFVEHMGRCVYGGIYEPGHPEADEDGFRRDVLALVRELGVTVVRYPGGNFVSGYRWEDGVGPASARPTRLDPAWHSVETNEFGLDEFVRWTRKAGVEPMLAMNLATRGVQEAIDLLEYANHPGGSALSDRRIEHGAKEPYGIRMWCLGNELDGSWQLGHKTAAEYARIATETARALRQFDQELELVACGSSGSQMQTFGSWEATVLAEANAVIDFLSLHAYYEEADGDLSSFLGSAVDLGHFIGAVSATADHASTLQRSAKRIHLSVDEWNVWYADRLSDRIPKDWVRAPRLSEDAYTVADAVVVGSLLVTLLQHADRVRCACLAQLVNTIAPIRAEPGGPAWRQATFHPFSLTASAARGDALRVRVAGSTFPTEKYGPVPAVDAVATRDADSGRAALFVVNRHPSAVAHVELDVAAFAGLAIEDARVLSDTDVHATNTQVEPNRVAPQPLEVVATDRDRVTFDLAPVAWARLSFSRTQ